MRQLPKISLFCFVLDCALVTKSIWHTSLINDDVITISCCMYCLYTGIACFSLSCKVLWVSESALWMPCQYCTVTAHRFRAPCWCTARPHTLRLRRTDAPSPWGPLMGGSCCSAWCWTSVTRTSSWSNTSLPATLPHPPPSMEMAPSRKWGVSSWTKMHKSFVEQLQSCRGCQPKFAPMFRWLAGGSRAFAASQTLWWWHRSSNKRDLKPAAFSDWNVQSHFIILVVAEEPRTLPHCGNLWDLQSLKFTKRVVHGILIRGHLK